MNVTVTKDGVLPGEQPQLNKEKEEDITDLDVLLRREREREKQGKALPTTVSYVL